MKCPKCNTVVKEQDRFCSECGTKLERDPNPSQELETKPKAPDDVGNEPSISDALIDEVSVTKPDVLNDDAPVTTSDDTNDDVPVTTSDDANDDVPVTTSDDATSEQVSDSAPTSNLALVSPAPQNQTAKKKASKKTLLFSIIGGVLGFCVVFFLIFTAFRIFGNIGGKKEKFFNSQVQTMKQSVLFSKIAPFDSKDISTDATITLDLNDLSKKERDFLDDAALLVKLDINKKRSLLNYNLMVDNKTVFQTLLKQEKNQYSFSFPEVNKEMYSLTMDEFLENQDISGFSNLKKKSLYETIDFSSVLKQRLPKYTKIIAKSMQQSSLKTKTKSKFSPDTVAGIDLDAKDVKITTWSPKREEMEDILLNFADALEKDKEMCDYISNMTQFSVFLFPYSGFEIDPEDIPDALRDNAKSIAKELGNSDFYWEVVTSKKKIVSIEVGTEEDIYFSFVQGMDGKKEYEDLYFFGSSYYNTYKKTKKTYEGNCAFRLNSPFYTTFLLDYDDIDFDKRSPLGVPLGSYNLTVPGMEMDIEVEADKQGFQHLIDFGYGELNIYTSKKSTAKEPSGNKVDITDYDEDDFGIWWMSWANKSSITSKMWKNLSRFWIIPTISFNSFKTKVVL